MHSTESIMNTALVGSARAAVAGALASATPEGALVSPLSDANAEQRLLLAAGVRAIYCLAGHAPERLDAPLEPAPAETKTVCPPNVADLIHQLLTARASDLLREALERMIAAGMMLPPEMLPLALGAASLGWDHEMIALRPKMARVAGERGAWLGRFNSAWSWVRAYRLDGISDADTIWQEGASADRMRALAHWRATDPAKARAEIAAVWRQEKADFRVELTEALASNLSADDEPLLETALDDRSGNVRAVAQRLLACIPGSAFQARAIARADALLDLGKKKLATTLPEVYEKSWERDGILEKPPQGTGERSWWLMRIVAVAPPAHWAERFGMAPADLIAAATDEHGAEVLEGWTRAAILYDTRDWIQPLVEGLRRRRMKNNTALLPLLLQRLPGSVLEPMALKIVRHGASKQDFSWKEVAPFLPRPWSAELAREWLAGLRAFASGLASLKGNPPDWWEVSDRLVDDNYSLATTPVVLPPECLDAALEPWDIGENTKMWSAITWREQHDLFLKAVRQRQRIRDEIPGE